MTITQLEIKLASLLAKQESEIVEFKEAKNTFDFGKLGKYFSALANEANLQLQSEAWLIFGVSDKKQVVGTQFRLNPVDLDSLKKEIASKTSANLTFLEIHKLQMPEGRVLLFQIPAAPRGLPIAWEGHYYGRNGEELSPLNIDEIERIRQQVTHIDWSAFVVLEATMDDLDEKAIAQARLNFKERNPHLSKDMAKWDTITFLNKAKLTIKGKITRTALLLLGKSESEPFLSPADAKIRWVLKNTKNQERDWSIFKMPFLLAVDAVYAKIRNLNYQYLKEGSLFPQEILRYEPFTIREALNNCIAHQDYTLAGRINVIENEDDELIFTNLGTFLPENVEKIVLDDAPQEQYRNRFLVEAMVNLKMVESIGSGIRKMFEYQRQRFFPMPEYTFQNKRVELRIMGKILDVKFAKTLALNPDLDLRAILMLDKVQKNKPIGEEDIKNLKKQGLIEGRKPNFYLAAKTVKPLTDELKIQYIKQKGFDDDHYKKMILEYLSKFGSANRKVIETLLVDKLPDILSSSQKKNKVTNLLTALRHEHKIRNVGSDHKSLWTLKEL
jgi:ATP-dependent DNA helicase RecG